MERSVLGRELKRGLANLVSSSRRRRRNNSPNSEALQTEVQVITLVVTTDEPDHVTHGLE
jgi:hypothetical protein